MDAELEWIKREISLPDLVLEYGYVLDRRASCKTSFVFRNETQVSKIVVATNAGDGHGVFFDVHRQVSGSVLDFVMFVEQCNLGHARRILRERLAGAARPMPVRMRKPEPVVQELAHLYAGWQSFQPYAGGYLSSRGLSLQTIADFFTQIRLDRRSNVVFRHDDQAGQLVGWESKNVGWTGFCAGGRKALFHRLLGDDPPTSIVVTESAIDCMSYWQLHQVPGLYLSFAGAMSDQQRLQLGEVFIRYPQAGIMAATDNDERGEAYARELMELGSVTVVRACPPDGCKDWNDVLKR